MATIKSIAVGYDGSVESADAVRWGAHLAREVGATLTVIHAAGILERLAGPFSHTVPPADLAAIIDEESVPADHFRWLVDEGDACSALLHSASAPVNADLLVVGSRGHGKRPGMMMGSVSLEIVQHSSIPVVVVPGR